MKPPKRRKIFDVVGEAALNADGISRQDILRAVEPGERAQLIREPNNAFDPNAIAVWVEGGQIGYLCREDAAALAPSLDGAVENRAIVHCVRGGVPGAGHYGCRVSVAWGDDKPHPFVPLDEQQLRSRSGKLKIAGRARDERGRLVGKQSGCLVIPAMLGFVSLLGITATIS